LSKKNNHTITERKISTPGGCKKKKILVEEKENFGGGERDRTDDLSLRPLYMAISV
jgi:hypothetical protein